MIRSGLAFGRTLQALGLALAVGALCEAYLISGAGAAIAAAFAAPLAAFVRTVADAFPAAPEPAATAAPQQDVGDAARFYAAAKSKQYAQAVAYGQRYVSANPHDDAFALDLAYAYVALGRPNDARALLYGREAYLQAHPQNAVIWLDLAYQDSAAKRYVRAIDDADQYLQFVPGDGKAAAQRAVDVAAVTPPTPDPSTLFYAAVRAGDYARALPYGTQYLGEHPSDNAFAMDLAFAEISAKHPDAAAAIAYPRMDYIRANAKATTLLASLFYAYSDAGQLDAAVQYGDQYLALVPNDDAFALSLAYADLSLGRVAQARAIVAQRESYLRAHPQAASIWMDFSYKAAAAKQYRNAIADVDTYLAIRPGDASAKDQRAAYVDAIWDGPRYQNYGYAQYEGRFEDVFFGFDQTYALAPGRVQPFAELDLTEDTRSGAPGAPQIYSDNALIADVGLRTHFGPYVTGFAEAGAGIGLRGQGTITDLRYGLRYFQQWGARNKPYTQVSASTGIYSRYGGNAIGYYQVLHDFGGKTIRPVVGINGGLDSHNVFGNNFIEGFAGAQTGTNDLTFRLVQVQGTYLTRGLDPSPKAPYSTIRGTLFFRIK